MLSGKIVMLKYENFTNFLFSQILNIENCGQLPWNASSVIVIGKFIFVVWSQITELLNRMLTKFPHYAVPSQPRNAILMFTLCIQLLTCVLCATVYTV